MIQQDIRSTTEKIKSPVLRILIYSSMIVISTLFGMYIRESTGGKEKDQQIITSQAKKINELTLQLDKCNDKRYEDKEKEYQRLVRKQEFKDSVDALTESIARKLNKWR